MVASMGGCSSTAGGASTICSDDASGSWDDTEEAAPSEDEDPSSDKMEDIDAGDSSELDVISEVLEVATLSDEDEASDDALLIASDDTDAVARTTGMYPDGNVSTGGSRLVFQVNGTGPAVQRIPSR